MSELIGEYNRKIEIWKRLDTKDAAGEPVVGNFAFYKQKWAKIRGRNGMSLVKDTAGTVTAPTDMSSYRVPFCEDVTVEMQVRHRGMVMDIIAIRQDEADREWTDIIVRTGGSDG